MQVGPAPELMMTMRFRFLSHHAFLEWDKEARGRAWEESIGISVGLPFFFFITLEPRVE